MRHTVAVYGSLKRGFHNNPILSTSTFKGVDVIEGWNMVSLGAFPGIFKGEGVVHIEVYEVEEEEMERLDRLEGYPTFYNRTQVDTEHGKAWIYYLNNPSRYSNSERLVEGGKW